MIPSTMFLCDALFTAEGERESMDNHGSTLLMDDTNLQAGVILGHYRCSLSGHDLNRVWANPDKIKHPCIWHIRDLVRISFAFFLLL